MGAAKRPWRPFRSMCMLLVTFAFSSPSFAQDTPGYPASIDAYDAREVAMLPQYCIYTQIFRQRVPGGNDAAALEHWRAVMGPMFEAMHHYCWGLMKTNRAKLLTRSRQQREFYLTDAIGEFDFVLQHVTDDFILLPEILTKKGENLALLGKGPVAVLMFERAAQVKPDYWPAYGGLSDVYLQQGDTAKAREALERGLESTPEAPGLKRRMAELNAGASKREPRRSSKAASAAPATP